MTLKISFNLPSRAWNGKHLFLQGSDRDALGCPDCVSARARFLAPPRPQRHPHVFLI